MTNVDCNMKINKFSKKSILFETSRPTPKKKTAGVPVTN